MLGKVDTLTFFYAMELMTINIVIFFNSQRHRLDIWSGESITKCIPVPCKHETDIEPSFPSKCVHLVRLLKTYGISDVPIKISTKRVVIVYIFKYWHCS